MLGSQRIELADELGVVMAGEISLDASLEGRKPQIVEACSGRPQDVAVGDIRERLPAPQRERLAKSVGSLLWSPVLQRPRPFRRESLEHLEVESVPVDAQDVPGISRLDRTPPQPFPELRDVPLEHVAGGLGWLIAPHCVDQPRCRNNLTGMQEQDGQHRSRPRAHPNLTTFDDRLDRAEDQELRGHPGERTTVSNDLLDASVRRRGRRSPADLQR